MTIDDAKAVILAGAAFGTVCPLLAEPDADVLRAWYVHEPGVPVVRAAVAAAPEPRPARGVLAAAPAMAAKEFGYTGDVCPKCQGSRVRRTGTCPYCEDCNESIGGCS